LIAAWAGPVNVQVRPSLSLSRCRTWLVFPVAPRYDRWRTNLGPIEREVLGDEASDGVFRRVSASRVDNAEFRSVKSFREEHHPRKAILVCNERAPRVHDGIQVLPWREFLRMLWSGAVLK